MEPVEDARRLAAVELRDGHETVQDIGCMCHEDPPFAFSCFYYIPDHRKMQAKMTTNHNDNYTQNDRRRVRHRTRRKNS